MLIIRRFSLSSIGRRERIHKRMIMEECNKINLSNIPSGFINFHDIDNLAPRELAYTAHLASRGGLENEVLWNRIRDSFFQSIQGMKPKYLTRCFVSISEKSDLSHCELESVLLAVSRQVHRYRPVDLVMILSAVT